MKPLLLPRRMTEPVSSAVPLPQAAVAAPDPARWTDEFLDSLRSQGDPAADEAFQRIIRDNEAQGIRQLFRDMNVNGALPPAETFPVLADFFATTGGLPAYADSERIRRGENVFMSHPFEGALVLLTKSLPEGYAAPGLSIILNLSGDLRTHPYKRLLATLQTVVNVSTQRGFQPEGRAVITAQKLRLLHAGIRYLTLRYRPGFAGQYGVPVNQEDMLATVMGFSWLVIKGWRELEMGLTPREEEDFLYLWLVFAHMMGIHPAGQPGSLDYLPMSVDDAARFYAAYERRHYVQAARNPDGVALARANLRMLKQLLPRFLRSLGFGVLPGIIMHDMMGAEMCGRLRIRPVPGSRIIKIILLAVHRLLSPLARSLPTVHEHLGRLLFQEMIDQAYGGQVTFSVPTTMSELKHLIDEPGAPQHVQV